MFHVLVNNMSMCVSSNQLNMVYVYILCISLQTGLIQMPGCLCIHTEANKKVPPPHLPALFHDELNLLLMVGGSQYSSQILMCCPL